MIKITNGFVECEVSKGAYNDIFRKQGFVIVEDEAEKEIKEENRDSENKFVELLEKPLSTWTKEEVKTFADKNNIDITGTKNVGEAKNRIKAFLK